MQLRYNHFMSDLHKLYKYYRQILQSGQNIFFYHFNRLLTWMAELLESETFDSWRIRYGNWYNLRLLRLFLDRSVRVEGELVTFHITSMETLGKIVIAKMYYAGCSKTEAIEYIEGSMQAYMPQTIDSLQSSVINNHNLKFTFSL